MKKWMGVSLVAAMAAMSLTACGSGGKQQAGTDGGAASAAPVKHDPVTLVVQNAYNSDDEARFMQDYGTKIQTKYPWISFQYSKLTDLKNRVTNGDAIDIVTTSVGQTPSTLLEYHLQSDISDLITKNKFDLSRLEPSTVQMQHDFANGGIYGLPVNSATYAMFYNKDIFDKFGVAYPKDNLTWDDTYELAKKLSRMDGETQYYGFGVDIYHMMRLNQMSLPYLDKSNRPLFADDNFKKLVDNFTRFGLMQGNNFPNFFDINTVNDKFVKDKSLAIDIAMSNTILETRNAAAFATVNWDAVTLPSFKDNMGVAAQSYPLFFYISATSKHRDEAFQAISYLTTDEFQLDQAKRGILPVVTNRSIMDAFGQGSPQLKGKNRLALAPKKYAAPSPFNKYNPIAESALIHAMSLVVTGKADLNSALRDAVDAADKAVKAKAAGQ